MCVCVCVCVWHEGLRWPAREMIIQKNKSSTIAQVDNCNNWTDVMIFSDIKGSMFVVILHRPNIGSNT